MLLILLQFVLSIILCQESAAGLRLYGSLYSADGITKWNSNENWKEQELNQ